MAGLWPGLAWCGVVHPGMPTTARALKKKEGTTKNNKIMPCQDNCCAPKPAQKVEYETSRARAQRLKREEEEKQRQGSNCTTYVLPIAAFAAGFIALLFF